jgi:Skp1 family, tetramerisation domain
MSEHTITLIACDGVKVVVKSSEIAVSQLVSQCMMNDSDPSEIPLQNVKAGVLAQVLRFCQYYTLDPMRDIPKVSSLSITCCDIYSIASLQLHF